MKLFGLYCGAVILAGAVLISQGMTQDNLVFFSADGPNAPLSITADPGVEQDVTADLVELAPASSGVDGLRAQYLEAARQRASLMDEQALRKALQLEEKKVAELRAQQALRQVEERLQQITSEYPETEAGRRAGRLLHQLQNPAVDRGFRSFDDFDSGPSDDVDRFSRDADDAEDDFAAPPAQGSRDRGAFFEEPGDDHNVPRPLNSDGTESEREEPERRDFDRDFNNDF